MMSNDDNNTGTPPALSSGHPVEAPGRPRRNTGNVPADRVRATPNAIARLDLRTREALILRNTIKELTAHVGGNPSAATARLIEQAAWHTLHLAKMDDEMVSGAPMSDHGLRRYIAMSNSLTRILKAIGLKGAAQRQPTLRETLGLGNAA